MNNIENPEKKNHEYAVKLFEIAAKTAQQIEDDYDKIEALNDLACAYYQANYKDRALNVLALAVSRINQIDSEATKAFLLNKVASKYIEIGHSDHAALMLESSLLLTNRLEPSDSRDYTIIDIAFNYASIGQYEKSLAVSEIVEDEWKKVSKLFTDLIWYYVEAGKHEQVQEIIKSFKSDLWLLEEAAISYAQQGECQRAIQINEEITDRQSKSLTLIAIGDRYIDDGEIGKALDILDRARDLASNLQKNHTKSWLLDVIAKKYAKAGRKDLAMQILPKSMSFNQIAYSLIAAKDYQEAIELTESKQQHFTVLERVRIYSNVAREYLKHEQKEMAVSLLDKATAIADTLDSKIAKIEIQIEIAQLYAEAKQQERAIAILNTTARTVKMIENKLVIGNELRNLASSFAALGCLEKAIEIAKLVTIDREQVKVYTEVALSIVSTNKKSNSERKKRMAIVS
jgi:tetratricopeptide (TPR) repeat protein